MQFLLLMQMKIIVHLPNYYLFLIHDWGLIRDQGWNKGVDEIKGLVTPVLSKGE